LQCQWLWNAMRLRPQGVQNVCEVMHTYFSVQYATRPAYSYKHSDILQNVRMLFK